MKYPQIQRASYVHIYAYTVIMMMMLYNVIYNSVNMYTHV
jgi:hypothetical protein